MVHPIFQRLEQQDQGQEPEEFEEPEVELNEGDDLPEMDETDPQDEELEAETHKLRDRRSLLNGLMTGGFEMLQKELDVPGLQDKYQATHEQWLMLAVKDVRQPPWFIRVHKGKIIRTQDFDGEPDGMIVFRTLNALVSVLDGKVTINQVYAWEGRFPDKRGVLHQEVWVKGDFNGASIILREVFNQYLKCIQEVLHRHQVTNAALHAVAKVKGWFAGKGPECE